MLVITTLLMFASYLIIGFKCIRANTTLHVVDMLLDFNMKPSETENTLGADQRSQT